MPSTAAIPQATPPADTVPRDGILQAVAERLAPLFVTPGQTAEHARAAALEAIAAHHPESAADYASIARMLAFSFATIAVVARAADPDLSPSLQLRFLGKANTLSRSAEQAERGMIQRRSDVGGQPPTAHHREQPQGARHPEQPRRTRHAGQAGRANPGTPPESTSRGTTPQSTNHGAPGPSHRRPPVLPQPEPPVSEDVILAQVEAAMAEFHSLLAEPAVSQPKAPFAAVQPAASAPSFRQTLRQRTYLGTLHPAR